MQQRWADDNDKEADVIDTRIETFWDNNGVGYVPRMRYRVWIRDA